MPGRVFSRFAHRIREMKGERFPLHVGDTWLEPFEGGRMEDFRVSDHPGMHRYSSPQGMPALIDAVVEKLSTQNGISCDADSVLISAGATGGLGAAVGMLLSPGEEVLILAPYWPLIRGIVHSARGQVVDVPFYDRVDGPEAAVDAISERISERTVALYVSTPSNPTGRLLPESWLQAIAELARRENLWLLSDEVYESLVYAGEHVSLARFAPERTYTAFSFSKTYGMAGNRCGYLVGPPEAIMHAKKVSTHSFYSAPTASQLAGLAALRDGGDWLADVRERYRKAGVEAARILGVPAPAGSTFLFLDVADQLDEREIWGFLEDCLDDGLLLAPGPSFGEDYATWIRICFTSAPPEKVARACSLLAKRIR
jgi:N-succinyldiaminopimelate aminotransferase